MVVFTNLLMQFFHILLGVIRKRKQTNIKKFVKQSSFNIFNSITLFRAKRVILRNVKPVYQLNK